MATSLIAVGGTLAGALLTFLFGLVTARRSQRHAREERLHEELRTAYAEFAAVANVMRQRANDRWHRHFEGAGEDVLLAVADAFYGARTNTWAAYYRMVVAGADADLTELAERIITAAGDIVHAPDNDEEHRRREWTSDLIKDFAVTAAARLRA